MRDDKVTVNKGRTGNLSGDGTVLEVYDLTRSYSRGSEEINALRGVTFSVCKGEMLGIMGRSGSGKTTLLNQIGCLDSPTSGIVRICGQDVTQLNEQKLVDFRRENIGFIFQLFYLIPTLTAFENIELPLIFARKRDPVRVRESLAKVGLLRNAHSFPAEMDGGDMQRVAIARALVSRPRILLADEPTGRLEQNAKLSIISFFRELSSEGLTVLVATHDPEVAGQLDRVIELKDGLIEREWYPQR